MNGAQWEAKAGAASGRVRRVDEMSSFFPETIAPTVPLTKELEALFEFLAHQKPPTGDRELNELAQLGEKELDAKIRELENWNFRLNLDEAKEAQDSISLGIVSDQQSSVAND